MTDLTDERLAEIRALAEAATPGDWRAVAFSSVVGCPIMTQPDKTKNSVVIAGVHGAFGDDYRAEVEANAAFIALGPKTTLALLDALSSARERAERAEAERDDSILRWCIRMADVREASGVGVKPMLDEVPGAIKARVSALESRATAAEARVAALEAVLRQIAEGLTPPVPEGHYLAHRAAVKAARAALTTEGRGDG